MDAKKYLVAKKRMCDLHNGKCNECPMNGCKGCGSIELTDPYKAVEIVENWALIHPILTNGMKLLKDLRPYIRQHIVRDYECKPYVEVWLEGDWWNTPYKSQTDNRKEGCCDDK